MLYSWRNLGVQFVYLYCVAGVFLGILYLGADSNLRVLWCRLGNQNAHLCLVSYKHDKDLAGLDRCEL